MSNITTTALPPTLMQPADGFLGLEVEQAVSDEQAKVVIIPFGLEASVSYGGGTAQGP